MRRSLIGTLLVISVVIHVLLLWGSSHLPLAFSLKNKPSLREPESFSATIDKPERTYTVSSRIMSVPPLSQNLVPAKETDHGQPKVEVASVSNTKGVPLNPADDDIIPEGPLPPVYNLTSGQSIVFLLDQSGSMLEPVAGTTRAKLAMGQLLKWLGLVSQDNRFNIVLYAQKVLQFQKDPITISSEERQRAREFLHSDNDCGGTTEFLAGLESALNNKPDVVLIITDGDLNLAPYVILRGVRDLRQRVSPSTHINVLGVYVRPQTGAKEMLERLANENDGKFEFWPPKGGES